MYIKRTTELKKTEEIDAGISLPSAAIFNSIYRNN